MENRMRARLDFVAMAGRYRDNKCSARSICVRLYEKIT